MSAYSSPDTSVAHRYEDVARRYDKQATKVPLVGLVPPLTEEGEEVNGPPIWFYFRYCPAPPGHPCHLPEADGESDSWSEAASVYSAADHLPDEGQFPEVLVPLDLYQAPGDAEFPISLDASFHDLFSPERAEATAPPLHLSRSLPVDPVMSVAPTNP